MNDYLPLTAPVDEITARIEQVQARCKVGKADPSRLAAIVRDQVDRAERVASLLGFPSCACLEPRMDVWEGGDNEQHDVTMATVSRSGIRVHRHAPVGWKAPGRLTLELRPVGARDDD